MSLKRFTDFFPCFLNPICVCLLPCLNHSCLSVGTPSLQYCPIFTLLSFPCCLSKINPFFHQNKATRKFYWAEFTVLKSANLKRIFFFSYVYWLYMDLKIPYFWDFHFSCFLVFISFYFFLKTSWLPSVLVSPVFSNGLCIHQYLQGQILKM